MKNVYLLLGLILSASFGINADYSISEDEFNEIKYKVSALDEDGLKQREDELINEINELNTEEENTQSPSKRKEIQSKLELLWAELSEVQKALSVFLGAFIIDSFDDSSSPDNVSPIIVIIGDNPATVELGTTYTDPGATATDAVDGSVTVVTTGTVDTDTVGSYTITYTARQSRQFLIFY